MLSALVAAALLPTQTKPNIVYIMADDLGYGELGCYGQEKIPTPNIDRLAREGVKFTRFYAASPVCAPTRCSLLTGMHQGHAAIRGNKEQGGFGPNDPEGQFPLPKSATTIAEVLQRAGYSTGLFGKWGLGGPKPGESPLDHGFDRFYGYLCQRRAHNYYPPYLWSDRQPDLLGNPVYDAHQSIMKPLDSEEEYYERYTGKQYGAEKIIDACVSFIDRNAGEPMFIYYAPTLPHMGLQAPKEWVDRLPSEWDAAPYLGQQGYLPCARPRATYAAMIAYLDDSVGKIMAALEKKGLAKNTLIVFTSDNGAAPNGGVDRAFFDSNGILRGGKMNVYEGGIRVPFVARWPERIPAGTVSDTPFACFDTMASLCEAAGIKSPKTDGISYWGAMTGGKTKKRDYLYFEYPEATSQQALLMGNYKVVRPNLASKPNQVELFDLLVDPMETNNIAAKHPDIVKKALEIMAREHVSNKDFPLPGIDKEK